MIKIMQKIEALKNWREKRIIGLDLDEGSVIATGLIKKQKQIYLDRYSVVSSLKEIATDSFFKGSAVVINLPAQVVLFRSFHLASSFLTSKNKQKDIIAFLSRQGLPFALDECFWDTFNLNSNLNLIAAKKEVVEKYVTQVQDLGFNLLGVTAAQVALYNILIYNYPEREKDRFALLNIRISSSDLLVYESNRLWVYPLSIGNRELGEPQETNDKFSIELQRIFNAHYLQNPPAAGKTPAYFYISGQGCSEVLVSSIKKLFGDFEILVLQPFKRIGILSKEAPKNQEIMSLSLGLGLTYLGEPPSFKINLIKGKVRKAQYSIKLNFLKRIFLYSFIFTALCLLFWNIKLIRDLKTQMSIYKNTQFQVSSVLPEVKTLKEEKQKLQNIQGFLENSLNQQGLYLKALVAISKSKPPSVVIKELDIQMKDTRLQVFLSGSTPAYQAINDFLTELKKDEDLKEVKVVASTFSTLETEVKEIDFKLHFELPGADTQAGRVSVLQTKDVIIKK